VSTPRFSLVIPTRARDDLLAKCLELLRPQVEQQGAEVIVTDDGAGSTTREMIEARFPFARWTRGPSRGPAANRNHGAALAEGEFILFLDDDIEPASDLLAGYAAALAPEINVYEGRTTCRAGLHSPLEHAPINETGGWLWSCNMMIRRSFWLSFGGFDEDFPYAHMEDVVFRERLKAAGEQFLFVPAATVDHPPRRFPKARVRFPIHESNFIYHHKYLGTAPSVRQFLIDSLRYRIRTVYRHPLGVDSLLAVGSTFAETWYVLRHWNEWNEKWKTRASGHSTPGAGPGGRP